MDYLDGRIFRDARLPGLPRAEQAAIYDQLNLTLTKLHQVDFNAIGLSDYGRPGNYFERQVKRWTKQYRDAETEVIPEMEELIATLPKLIPPDESISIAHGDYRLENTMFARDAPRLIAVLDWELSTIGHPLADIAYNCFLWHSRRTSWGTLQGVDFSTSGIPTEEAYLEAYCRRTGRSGVEHWNFYLAFAIFRLAAIGQGVYRRILAGIAASNRRAENNAQELSRQALAILQR
jgi:aminoglycoside phosphotransferase (APT) family kinase protein